MVSLQLMLLSVACLPHLIVAAGPVTLLSNVTFGGLICPTPAVEFTCTAVDAVFVEWRRNGDRISIILLSDTIGPSDDPRVPSGFEIQLTVKEQDNQLTVNFTTTLTANLSVLVNGSDQISCHSADGSDSISISYTGQQSAPPAPLFSEFSYTFSSLRDGEVTLNLTWTETFTTTHAVQMYRVRSDLCSEQRVESDTPFSCPGLVAGGEYMFWVRAVNCGDQEGEESQPLVVRPQVPSMPNVSSVVATYNEMSTAVQIVVLWEPVPGIQIIDQFTEPIWYIVTVDNSTGDQEVVTVTCDQSEGTCSALFPLLEAADYTVSISARNIVGGSDSTIYPNGICVLSCTPICTHLINYSHTRTHTHAHGHTHAHTHTHTVSSSSSYYDPSFSFENCITSVLCSSSLDLPDTTKCVVHYGTDPFYTLLSDPMNGPLNSMFQLPLLKPTTTYYFQTSVLINSTLTVQVQEEFSTGEFDPRLLSYHRGLITAGAILWIIALILTVINFLLLRRKDEALISSDNCFKMSVLAVLVVITIFILFSAILWVAVGFQVGLQQNTCDLNWQRHRNGLIISAFVLSVLSLATSSMFHVILILRCIKGSSVPVRDSAEEIKLEPPRYAPLSHGPEKKDDGFKHGGFDGHRRIGKSTKEGIVDQVKDEYGQLDQAAIGSGGDGVYDTTRHGEPPKPIPNPEDPQYSHIEQEEKKKDTKKNGDNTEPLQATGEYEHLSHGTGRPHPPSAPGSEEYGKLETHPQDQQAAIGSGGDGVYDVTRHDEPPKPVPNPEDPQYSHIQQGEEEKKKKDKKKKKKKKKNTPLEPGHPSDGTGQQGQTPGTSTQGQIPGTWGLVYDEPNTGPRNLSSVL